MDNISQICEAMHAVLVDTANNVAVSSGFVRRRSKITGAIFAQATVLGWLHNPQSTLANLAQRATALGAAVTPQALDQRFTKEAANFLEEILNVAVSQIVAAAPVAIPLLQRFSAVLIQDSSTIGLPGALAGVWAGCGGHNHKESAAAKIQVRLDLLSGSLSGPLLQNGRAQDKSSPTQTASIPEGGLRLADLGYFSLETFANLAAQGAFFLSRLHVQTVVCDEDGNRLDLLHFLQGQDNLDVPVRLGITCQLPARLLVSRVPEEVANRRRQQLKDEAKHKGQAVSKARLALAGWTILVTNIPVELLSLEEALVLVRVRWQIELLFKLWKQHGEIDEWRSEKPWRILCEFYAKLIGMVIQHWLILVSCWAYPNRSLVKAAQTIRGYALMIVSALAGAIEIRAAIEQICLSLTSGCYMNHRRKRPNTYQLLLDLSIAA